MSGRLSAVGDGVDCAEDDLAKASSPAKNIARRNNLENLINMTATSFLGSPLQDVAHRFFLSLLVQIKDSPQGKIAGILTVTHYRNSIARS
jgi:hypothetical protein